jgi:galactokinase
MKISQVRNVFKDLFINEADIYIAPGRINLIGEHTDYNDGFVLPAAIDKHVIFGIKENNLNKCRFHAIDLHETFDVEPGDLRFSEMGWPNYLMGVIDQLTKRGHKIKGFDCVVTSDIPIGAGLSSSAAIESGLAFGLNEMFDLGESKLEIVRLAQKAENEFVGVNCGIMDQFASVFGRAGHVFRLDCRSLDFEYFPLNLIGNGILLVDTKVKHSLASSEYNTRRKECESGVQILSENNGHINSLRDASLEMLQVAKDKFDPIVYKRCDYIIREIARVREACDDLVAGRIEAFGSKMYDTHEGLTSDYEVSCEELDFLVDSTKDNPDILGSRMMGGGFGGCTINIIKQDSIQAFKEDISKAFQLKFSHPPLFYDVSIDNGVRRYQEE